MTGTFTLSAIFEDRIFCIYVGDIGMRNTVPSGGNGADLNGSWSSAES